MIKFIAEHWVSWMIELLMLGMVAFFTIAEARETAEQTRAMLSKYDAAISKFAVERTQSLDSGIDSAKSSVTNIIDRFKLKQDDE